MNDTSSEHVFKNLINSLSLSVSLWMVCRASNQFGSERRLQLLLEACNELYPSIRNDCLRDTMQMNNLIEIDFGIPLSSISCTYGKKMSGFGKSINDYPDRVMFLRRVGKTTMKSILISSYFHDGMGSGWSVPDIFR
jgi:hypothetical protein